jgi:hypothetical protein
VNLSKAEVEEEIMDMWGDEKINKVKCEQYGKEFGIESSLTQTTTTPATTSDFLLK